MWQFILFFQRNKFDDVVNVILNNLDLEEKNEVKIIYLNCLLDLIKILQLRSLRHSRKLLDMLAREINIETNDYMNTLLLQVIYVYVCFVSEYTFLFQLQR